MTRRYLESFLEELFSEYVRFQWSVAIKKSLENSSRELVSTPRRTPYASFSLIGQFNSAAVENFSLPTLMTSVLMPSTVGRSCMRTHPTA